MRAVRPPTTAIPGSAPSLLQAPRPPPVERAAHAPQPPELHDGGGAQHGGVLAHLLLGHGGLESAARSAKSCNPGAARRPPGSAGRGIRVSAFKLQPGAASDRRLRVESSHSGLRSSSQYVRQSRCRGRAGVEAESSEHGWRGGAGLRGKAAARADEGLALAGPRRCRGGRGVRRREEPEGLVDRLPEGANRPGGGGGAPAGRPRSGEGGGGDAAAGELRRLPLLRTFGCR